jgi:hypothetical protein
VDQLKITTGTERTSLGFGHRARRTAQQDTRSVIFPEDGNRLREKEADQPLPTQRRRGNRGSRGHPLRTDNIRKMIGRTGWVEGQNPMGGRRLHHFAALSVTLLPLPPQKVPPCPPTKIHHSERRRAWGVSLS